MSIPTSETKQFVGCLVTIVCLLASLACGCQSKQRSQSEETKSAERQSNDEPQSTNAIPQETEPTSLEIASEIVAAEDWQHFRGPGYLSTTPNAFSPGLINENNLLWKHGLPGRGASSPIVANGRIFLTAYDGFGLEVTEGDDFRNLRHHILCFDQQTGACLWQRVIKGTSLLQKMNPELARHGFASSTLATDGESLFAFFGVTGLFAFDRDGNLKWQRNLGVETHYFGSSASPILFGGFVIVNASIECHTVFAFDKLSGSIAYMIPDINECWSTPVLGKNERGETEMVISHKNTVASYDPKTGKQLWQCKGIQDYVVAVPIIVDGVCYLTGGKQKQTIAVRLGGSGDVEATHKLYDKPKMGSNVSSPVYHEGRLYIVHDNGILQIIDAKTGDLIKRQRTATRTRPFASPLLAGSRLFMPFQDAGIGVYEADSECEELVVNRLPDGLPLMASLVPCGKGLLVRNDRYLYHYISEAKVGEVSEWTTPDDHQVVETIESYNINPEKQWSRRYLGFLTPQFGQSIRFLLMPYQSVITDEQTQLATRIIRGEKTKYDELLKRYEALRWEELKTPANEGKKFHERYATLEKDVKALNEATRILVKKLLSKEQMEQHYADAKARKAHIKPDVKSK